MASTIWLTGSNLKKWLSAMFNKFTLWSAEAYEVHFQFKCSKCMFSFTVLFTVMPPIYHYTAHLYELLGNPQWYQRNAFALLPAWRADLESGTYSALLPKCDCSIYPLISQKMCKLYLARISAVTDYMIIIINYNPLCYCGYFGLGTHFSELHS